MRITELLKKESIELGVTLASKEAAIDKLTGLMEAGGRLKDRAGYKEGILAREAQGSTAVGEGIAIPHAKVEAVKEPGLAAVTVPEGVDYEAFDGSLAKLIFMIAAPAEGADVHLEALARLSTLLMTPGFKDNLLSAASKEEFLAVIDAAETEKFGEKEPSETLEKAEQEETAKKAGTYQILAVTACPTGIAHTYMAAEALQKAAKKHGIQIKVETQGSIGVENEITAEDVAAADAIILTKDISILGEERFKDIPIVRVWIGDAIKKADAIIGKIEKLLNEKNETA